VAGDDLVCPAVVPSILRLTLHFFQRTLYSKNDHDHEHHHATIVLLRLRRHQHDDDIDNDNNRIIELI
jgi:hypothetical protein